MMLKNVSRLEQKIGDRIYHLTCDTDSPLTDVKEVLFQFLKYVGHIEDQIKAAQAQQSATVEPITDIKQESENGVNPGL